MKVGLPSPYFEAHLIHSYDDNKPFLYLGSSLAASLSPKELKEKHSVTHILNVTKEIPLFHEASGELIYFRIPIDDSPRVEIQKHFDEAHNFLQKVHESRGTCLVHCQAGISRSSTITISFLMRHLKLPLNDAFQLTKSRRDVVSPNLGFILQLIEFEKVLFGSSSFDFRDYATDWIRSFLPAEVEREKVKLTLEKHDDNVDAAMDELFSS
eukprot:TRINITY_DN943_c0_g2_i1.p1 TRINITY_DN943_c0_g2~~TRINITY_DN943_c0_g2_i1.p1  ORF type:complete len:211 (-),score=42.53 TRINITY_DN943_c0_g2_i1:177-809(-)